MKDSEPGRFWIVDVWILNSTVQSKTSEVVCCCLWMSVALARLVGSIYVLTTQMSGGTHRTLACHRGDLVWARPESWRVRVHCARPAALAPADRPQESGSPWCTGICWAPSPIAGLSPFRMSAWPRNAQERKVGERRAGVKSCFTFISQRQLIEDAAVPGATPLLHTFSKCKSTQLTTLCKVSRTWGKRWLLEFYNKRHVQTGSTVECLTMNGVPLFVSRFLCWIKKIQRDAAGVGQRHCGILQPPPTGEQNTEDVITTVLTLIGDFDALCKSVEGKSNLFYLEGVSIATPHIILHPVQTMFLVNKGTWRGRDGNLTGSIVLKFQPGTKLVIWFGLGLGLKIAPFVTSHWLSVLPTHL